MSDFYDRMAKQFGGYAYANNKPQYSSVYPTGDPEEVFKAKILGLAQPSDLALDIGCGDGKFAFEVAGSFKHITGLDSSTGLIDIAHQKQLELSITNTDFVLGDASHMPFANQSFNLAYNRRGPSFYGEYSRVLKLGGYYVEIGVTSQDSADLKRTFGRGQDYDKLDVSRLTADTAEFAQVGLRAVLAQDFFYDEYFNNQHEFEVFLNGVPIFEDFDPVADRPLLDRYYASFTEPDGRIKLNRHRVVYVAQKL